MNTCMICGEEISREQSVKEYREYLGNLKENKKMKITTTNNRIRKMLMGMGVDPSLLGYKYLIDAVSLVYSDRGCLDKMTSVLYPRVAEMNETTSSRAERAIRHAIERISDFNPYVYELFPAPPANGSDKYTNSQFIAYCAEILKMEDDEKEASENA